MSGEAIAPRIAGGNGVDVRPDGTINFGSASPELPVSGAIGTSSVQQFVVPEDTSVALQFNMVARLVDAAATSVAAASASYAAWGVARRDGAGPAVFTLGAFPGPVAATMSAEEASGTLPADWSVSIAAVGSSVVMSFVIANNAYGGAGNVRVKGSISALLSVNDAFG